MPLEFENYLQPCGVSNFYAAVASNGETNFNDIEITVKNKNTFKLPTMNDVAQRNQDSLKNGNVQNNQLAPINGVNKLSSLVQNGLSNNAVFLMSNGSNDGPVSVTPDELDGTSSGGRGRVLKQRKIGRSEHNFDESLLDVFGNQIKSSATRNGVLHTGKSDATSGYSCPLSNVMPGQGRPLTPAMRQHSLPARISTRNDSIEPDANPRRRHHSVKFADEIGKLLSTCMLIPSRYDDTERKISGAHNLLDDSDDSDFEAFSTSISRRTGGGNLGGSNGPVGRNEFNRARRSGDLSQLQLPFRLSFEPPVSDYDLFLSKLQSLNVCLERVKLELVDVRGKTTSADSKSLSEQPPALREMAQCVVRVANITFHKHVFARCTSDDWLTSTDLDATYVDPGTGGFSVSYDTFVFSLAKPPGSGCSVSPSGRPGEAAASRSGGSVEFSICFEANGVSHWDNNSGRNYRITWS